MGSDDPLDHDDNAATPASPGEHDALDRELDEHLAGADPRVRARIEEWARKLIDLSRRNRLLVYRATKRSTLVLRLPDPDTIVQRLLDGKSWLIYRPSPLPPASSDPSAAKSPTLDDVLVTSPPSATELVTDQRDPGEIDRSLIAIGRRATAEYEDRGTHTLHVIWGLLRWADPGSQEDWVAPLVLVPAELRRKSIADRFELKPTEDDAVFNPALRVKLENDFGIKLPEVDLEAMTLDGVVEAVRRALQGLPSSWTIESYAAVGLFSFAREPMFRDLVEHAQLVAESPAVQSLALGSAVEALRPALDVPVPDEAELDRVQRPEDVYSVLDADSSQRLAVEAAIRGQSFVLFGPPGTGKSQTISNIIAEFVARGRSVLFVSEKMAALEVVAARLRDAELGDLLLELHSAKASRSEVAQQLLASLDESVHADDRAFPPAATTLDRQRSRLNDYVMALHEVRAPLGRSAYDVIGESERLSSAPALPAPVIDHATADTGELDRITATAARLADAWDPVADGPAFIWREASITTFTAIDRQRVMDILRQASEALAPLAETEDRIVAGLALVRPDDPDRRDGLAAMAGLVAQPCPGPIEWLTTDDLTPHRSVIEAWAETARVRLVDIERLEQGYGHGWRSLPDEVAGELMSALSAVDAAAGIPLEHADAAAALTTIAEAATGIVEEFDRLEPVATRLRAALGVRARGGGLMDLRTLVDVARISQDRHRPLGAWLGRTRLEDAERFMADYAHLYEAERVATSTLLAHYDEAILSLPLDPLLDRMRRHHGRWWNLLRPSHRADRAQLTALTRVARLRPQVIDDLEAAVALKAMRDQIDAIRPEAAMHLGPYAAGYETDIAAARHALAAARRLIDLPHDSTDWGVLAGKATQESAYDPSVDQDADVLVVALDAIQERLTTLSAFMTPALVDQLQAAPRVEARGTLTDLAAQVSAATDCLARFVATRHVPGPSTSEVRSEAAARVAIAEADRRLVETEDRLRGTFRDRWRGFDSDWVSLTQALDWSLAIRGQYGGGLVPAAAAAAIVDGRAASLPWGEFQTRWATYRETARRVGSLYKEELAPSVELSLLGKLESARDLIDRRIAQIDRLGIWVRFRTVLEELRSAGWGDFADAAVERGTRALDLEPAARRAWLDGWVRAVVEADARLAGFTREDHERAVQAFRSADQTLIRVARERVLKRYEEGKPLGVTLQGGEQAIVRQEAAKRRRLRPVRILLGSIPNLLPRIKPCLMMSPLSVSHFLAPTSRFDLVIFDEASQVPPEDAINCVYRGRQLIVAGDPKQLPPTDFFRLSATIESDLDIDTDVDDFESVLDLASGSGFVSRPLRWHYRSQDDSLIAFSNQFVYDGSLVTFPSPDRDGSDVGVSFVHCPDGIFDRGRTAKNPVEARRVADVVASELRRDPGNSIGVVAFSVAQQQAIEDEWERRIRLEPDLEVLAGVGRLHGMFIKNLETVQGDERDVIVFSIGYGRDEAGRMLMNFGPLNRAGGWRRLNVAVTRARQRVVVVSSIRSDDITRADVVSAGGPPKGSELLRAYLEYAEHGTLPAIASHGASRGPADSEFEREVAAAIQALGWETVTQVGTSGYRIDIGVVSKRDPSRFVVGLECDGMMYHSAKTARDRDRLRQGVLERLGWRIIRIWSQDWYERRGAAIARLRSEIEAADAEMPAPADRGYKPPDPEPRVPPAEESGSEADPTSAGNAGTSAPEAPEATAPPQRERTRREPIDLREKADAINLPWTTPYPAAELPPYSRTWMEFHDPGMTRHHASMLGALVDAEGPVHRDYAATRLARHFGLQRVGQRMNDAIDLAVQEASRSGRLTVRGPFLWPMGLRELSRVRVPVPGKPETARTIDRIPPEEIDLAILHLVKSAVSIDEASLRVSAARVLGFDRTADRIGEHLDARINAAIEAHRLIAAHAGLTLADGVRLPPISDKGSG